MREGAHFTSLEELDCASNVDALKQGIKSAIAIASDEVSSGKPFFGAEVKREQGNKELIRYVVAVGASRIKDRWPFDQGNPPAGASRSRRNGCVRRP